MPAKRSLERVARNLMSSDKSGNFRLLSEIELTQSMVDFQGESILYFDSGRADPNRFLIFSNRQLKEFSQGVSDYQMDGTFKLCPSVYNNGLTSSGQLYTIHAKKDGILVPCYYILMAKKTASEYGRIFEKLRDLVGFNLSSVMIDMEQAVVSAVSDMFTECWITFCFFHFRQSIWRWIQANGMCSRYSHENNNWFRKLINQHACLAFVPPNDVIEAFECLQQTIEDRHLEDGDVEAFIGYFESSFIGRVRRNGTRGNPRHGIEMWNQYNKAISGENRTNNSVEGWHHAMLSISNCHHPHFGKFLDIIKQDMLNSRIKIVQSNTGIANTPQRSTYKMLSQRYKVIAESYNADSKIDYLTSLALIFQF